MKRKLAILFALLGWFAVIAQFFLMIGARVTPLPETIIRFFSFFTILTNILVAIYFTCVGLGKGRNSKWFSAPGTLTAITIYISMVGLVYQVALRHVWDPRGLQRVVDELLHSVIPLLAIIFWALYENIKPVRYNQVLKWAIYPLAYLAYILLRGSFSGFYPYPFINVASLGMTKALINAGILVLVFIGIAALFLFIGKSVLRR